MACFLVSAAEAVVVKAVEKVEKKREEKSAEEGREVKVTRIPWSRKLKWLFGMLIGGAVLLMFEHIWHGEVTPWFPFLTAMSSPEETSEMLHEMATVGVSMAVLVTFVWGAMCLVADHIVKRSQNEETKEEETIS